MYIKNIQDCYIALLIRYDPQIVSYDPTTVRYDPCAHWDSSRYDHVLSGTICSSFLSMANFSCMQPETVVDIDILC